MDEYGSKLRLVHKNSRQLSNDLKMKDNLDCSSTSNQTDSSSQRKEKEEYTYKYLREKVNDVPLYGKDADIFFAYIHVTKRNECEGNDVSFCLEEKRVFHYHVPKEELPPELKVISLIEQGEWSYSLTEQEYLELIDNEKTSDVDFITYRLNKRRLLYVIE